MDLADLYQHPGLGFAETRTAAVAVRELRAAGFAGTAAARTWLPAAD